jgi:aspartyl-tRNA(Asn)/glutamyl-tRNA(Gln) amidotransferase subunit A
MTDELWALSATELRTRYLAGDLSPLEATEAILARMQQLDPVLHAFITPTPDIARDQARAAEARYRRGDTAPPLLGVPVSIKDLVWTKGVRTTSGALLKADFVPDADAPVVERLRDAGTVMLGKTSVPEVGWKAETTNRLIGSTYNPWRLDRAAGGSSGGAAAAVAAGLGPIAQGSDGAGSIRVPSSFCGIFGLKPTFGTVPLWPPSSTDTLSHIGPMTRTVADAALMLEAMAGPDRRDLHTAGRVPGRYSEGLGDGIEGIRIAYSPDLGYVDVDPEVAAACADAVSVLGSAGAHVEEPGVAISDPWPIVDALWATSEAAEYPDGVGDVRDRLDPGRIAVLEAGLRMSGAQLAAAAAARHAHYRAVDSLFDQVDLLATPTVPVPAFEAGLDSPVRDGRQTSYLGWTGFTYPFNLSGHPAATVPCGLTSEGLPVGLQLVGRMGEDALVLRAAAAFETLRPWREGLDELGRHLS